MHERHQHQIETLHAQQASAWVEILREPSAQQRAEFVAWLKESPRNVRDFLSMLALDQALHRLDAERRQDIESLLAQADRSIVQVADRFRRRTIPHKPQRYWRALAIAAGLALIAVCAALLMPRGQGWQEFHTVAGEQRAFELEDGSVMHLNTRSRVALRFSKQSRDIRLLEGEALFRVHHDPSAPFRVHTDAAMIQAVGTQFNVYARAEGTSVAVIEGRVKVSSERNMVGGNAEVAPGPVADISLSASEVATINPAGAVSVQRVPDVTTAIAWRERRLIFKEDSLADIVEEFNRYNREQIQLGDPTIAARVYSGVFDADDPESLVEVLTRDPDLSVEQSGQKILIAKR